MNFGAVAAIAILFRKRINSRQINQHRCHITYYRQENICALWFHRCCDNVCVRIR